MKFHFYQFRFTKFGVAIAISAMLAAVKPGLGQTPPPVPSTYQDLYTTLSSDLDAFNASINASWNGSKYPTALAGNLHSANGNSGPSLVTTYYTGAALQLQALKAIGVQAVMVQVGFPILYQPFYDFIATQPGAPQVTYDQFVSYYQQVAQNVRAAGLKLIVENDTLLSNDAQAGWGPLVTPYYAGLSWDQYQTARAQCALTVAQVMQPDYLVILEEPDTEATQTGQSNVATASGATALVTGMLAALQPVQGTVKVGAGVANWENTYQSYIQSFVTLPLDFIDMHVYPINSLGAPNNYNFATAALNIAGIAAAAGKPITVTESWLWKMRDSDWGILTADDIRARGAYSFWEPLDAYFMQTMENLASYTQMPFMSISNFEYFWAYVDYDSSTSTLSTTDLLNLQTTLGNQNVPQAIFTPSALAYYGTLVTPTDTTPPSVPTNVSGIPPSATSVNLSWNSATDNIGVAGYYVLRNGTQIASTAQAFYLDAGLTQNTTYTYQVEAFDLGGNTSAPVQVNVTTPNATVPNPPANVAGSAISCQQVTVSWSVPPGNIPIDSYLVFQGTSPSNLAQIAQAPGTTYTFSSYQLTPGTTYYFGLQATSSGLVSPMSAVIAVTTLAPPSTPAGVAASVASAARVNLTWSASTGGMPIASYRVYRGASSGNLSQIATTATTSYTDITVSPATTYYYAAQATDTGGNLSAISPAVSATTPPMPATPTSVAATANSATKVTVTWSEAVTGMPIASYQIFRGSSPGAMAQVATRTTTSYVDSSAAPGTTYYYAVAAVDTGGDVSVTSNSTMATTPVLPSTPANVAASASSATKIVVTWSASTGSLPIVNYRIFRGGSASSLAQVATRTAASYTDTTVSPATMYYYAVEAVDSAGDVSAMSAPASATTPIEPSAPAGVSASAISGYKMSVAWSAATGGLPISSYRVFRGTGPGSLSQVATTANTAYTDSSLTPATTYYYAVEAVDKGGDVSPMSAVASGTTATLPSTPAASASPVSSVKVSVTWTTASGSMPIASYKLFRGSSASTLSQIAATTKTAYTDTTVSASTTYYYAVEAVDTGGDVSGMSAAVPVTTPAPPSQPTGLAASAISAYKMGLTWSASAGGLAIANYKVFRGSSAAGLSQIATTTKTSYTDTTVSPGGTYYYAVEATDTGGDVSPMSSTAQATAPVPPPAPTMVTAAAVSSTQVSVSWSAVTADLPVTSYRIFRGTSPSSLTQVAIRTGTTYSDGTVAAATTYYYAVEAVDSGGDVSPMSAPMSVTTP